MSQPTQPSTRFAGSEQRFVPVSAADLDAAVAELAVVLNSTTEASKPNWVRRLVRLTDTGALGMTVNTCCAIHDPDERLHHPWTNQNGMSVFTVARPLKEAVAILGSGESTEIEIERRRKLFEAFMAENEQRRVREERR